MEGKKKKVREEVRQELPLQVRRKAVHVLLPRVEIRQRERKRNTNGNHEASRSWSRSVASLGCLRSQDIPGVWERQGWYWRAGLACFSTQTNVQDPSRVRLVPTLQRASSWIRKVWWRRDYSRTSGSGGTWSRRGNTAGKTQRKYTIWVAFQIRWIILDDESIYVWGYNRGLW